MRENESGPITGATKQEVAVGTPIYGLKLTRASKNPIKIKVQKSGEEALIIGVFARQRTAPNTKIVIPITIALITITAMATGLEGLIEKIGPSN